jgi:hypothetical protein
MGHHTRLDIYSFLSLPQFKNSSATIRFPYPPLEVSSASAKRAEGESMLNRAGSDRCSPKSFTTSVRKVPSESINNDSHAFHQANHMMDLNAPAVLVSSTNAPYFVENSLRFIYFKQYRTLENLHFVDDVYSMLVKYFPNDCNVLFNFALFMMYYRFVDLLFDFVLVISIWLWIYYLFIF